MKIAASRGRRFDSLCTYATPPAASASLCVSLILILLHSYFRSHVQLLLPFPPPPGVFAFDLSRWMLPSLRRSSLPSVRLSLESPEPASPSQFHGLWSAQRRVDGVVAGRHRPPSLTAIADRHRWSSSLIACLQVFSLFVFVGLHITPFARPSATLGRASPAPLSAACCPCLCLLIRCHLDCPLLPLKRPADSFCLWCFAVVCSFAWATGEARASFLIGSGASRARALALSPPFRCQLFVLAR